MDCAMYSRGICDGGIILSTASDIAQFDFIVQDSVSYLDLKLRTDSRISNCFGSFCDRCRPKPFTNFVNTEEKCRLFFAPSRRLLYTLHLDLPKGRERSLKDGDLKCFYNWRCCSRQHIAEIIPIYEFHADCLSDFIRDALNTDMPKEKILKCLAKPPFSELYLLSGLDISITSKFIDCFYPEVTDSEVAELLSAFIKQFDVLEYMGEYEEPKILEFLLYQSRLHGNIILDDDVDIDLINHCIFKYRYLNIGPILKYISDFRPTDSDCDDYLLEFTLQRTDLAENISAMAANKSITKKRLYLMMQVIWTYLDRHRGLEAAASEALSLIWSSVPDPFVTYEELKVFGALFSEEELTNVFNFYVKAIGELNEYVELRSLKHLCRTGLRRTFERNNLWIPDGIRLTGLPKSLQSFLNLEDTYAV